MCAGSRRVWEKCGQLEQQVVHGFSIRPVRAKAGPERTRAHIHRPLLKLYAHSQGAQDTLRLRTNAQTYPQKMWISRGADNCGTYTVQLRDI